MPDSTATAVWIGGLKGGDGAMALGGGTSELPYSAGSRFENGSGTNPEELIGGALAGCFSMALAKNLEDAGFEPNSIHTGATVSLEKTAGGFTVTQIALETQAQVTGGIAEDHFKEIATETKKTCPIAKVLSATNIMLKASLV